MTPEQDVQFQNVKVNDKLDYVIKELTSFKADFKELKDEIREDFVRKGEFNPVRNAVYALYGAYALALLGLVVALIGK